MLSKFCAWSGCKEIVPINKLYCDKHTAAAEAQEAQRQSSYDKRVRLTRDKQYHSFYLSPEWERMKQYIHNKYHGLCLYSLYVHDTIVQADAIHHIVPLKDDWSKRLSTGNLIPLGGSVHGMIESGYTHGDKAEMQGKLFNLLQRWEKQYENRG